MLSIDELKGLARRMKAPEFRKQLGPFVLVQKPDKPSIGDTHKMGLPSNVQRTTVASEEAVSTGTLSLLFQFDALEVVTVPPLEGVDELMVGRQPDNDLVLEHSSVSKVHAKLRWDDAAKRCSVQDVGSTNGTFLNAGTRLKGETVLRDGDILSFGEVQYWYLLTETLYTRLWSQTKAPGV